MLITIAYKCASGYKVYYVDTYDGLRYDIRHVVATKNDIVKLCHFHNIPLPESINSGAYKEVPAHFIYFIRCMDRVKIGITSSLNNRLYAIRLSSAFPVDMIYSYEGDISEEKRLHKNFANLHVKGEWFLYHDSIKEFIKDKQEKER